jgi:hypothetical protein
MKFMVIVKATKESEAGVLPSPELMEAMGKFNEELVKAGVLLAAEGLQASSKGARVKLSGSKRTGGGWAVCRDQGTGGWLLVVAGEFKRRSDRVGEAMPITA